MNHFFFNQGIFQYPFFIEENKVQIYIMDYGDVVRTMDELQLPLRVLPSGLFSFLGIIVTWRLS